MLFKKITTTTEEQIYSFTEHEIILLLIAAGKIPPRQSNRDVSIIIEHDPKKKKLFIHRDVKDISGFILTPEQEEFLKIPLGKLCHDEVITHKLFRELNKKEILLSDIFETSKEIFKKTSGITVKSFNEIEYLFNERKIPWS